MVKWIRAFRSAGCSGAYRRMRIKARYLGAFGTGRVSPRSAGKRSSFGAWPVVVPTFGGFAVFGASGSAGWCGSAVGGGAASILMPSPSIRGAGAFCAAATLTLKSSAAKARERFLIGASSRPSPVEERDALTQVPGALPWRVAPRSLGPFGCFDDCSRWQATVPRRVQIFLCGDHAFTKS